MTPEQREALRQEVIRWIGSKDFEGYLKALHLDPTIIPSSLLASFVHGGGLWPWDIIRIRNERGFATSSTRRRYLKLAKTGKISLGYICNAEQTPADSKTEYVSAHILASTGGTTEDDDLVESCLVMHDALSRVAKSKNFPTSDAGSVSGVFRVGNSAYDYGQPSSIYVFNALLHKSTNVPSKGRPRIVCIVNPHCWPTILPIPFAIAKQCVPTLADERPDPSEEIDWSIKEYPGWQQAMRKFLDKRIKAERRSFYDSLTWMERIKVISSINEDLKSVELDAVIAVRKGQTEKLSEFLTKGISPDLKGLMENAFLTDNIEIVSMLLARGANPNRTVNGIGDTLLHEATSHANPEIVKLLLAKGADPNLKRRDGRNALYCANKQMKEILEPLTEPPRLSYNVDDFLKMEDPEKAYYALTVAIRKDERFTPAELRVMSLDEFFALGFWQGVFGLYWQRRWSIIPCSELMSAIDEPIFAEIFQRGIAVIREYGQKIGRDPLDPKSDFMDLDEETWEKLRGPGMDFDALHYDTDLLCRKTMDYVRKNRELFT